MSLKWRSAKSSQGEPFDVTQNKNWEEKKMKNMKTQHQVFWCPQTTIHIRAEGPTVQLCGDSEVAGKWINGRCARDTEGELAILKRRYSRDGKEKSHTLSQRSTITYNQEADHSANLGADGQTQIVVDNANNNEKRKAVRGFWDGSSTINGRSGCGVVIKGVDRNLWIAISTIAVPLGNGTAMTAELVGVCVLTWILESQYEKISMHGCS